MEKVSLIRENWLENPIKDLFGSHSRQNSYQSSSRWNFRPPWLSNFWVPI